VREFAEGERPRGDLSLKQVLPAHRAAAAGPHPDEQSLRLPKLFVGTQRDFTDVQLARMSEALG
jgi:hypothetical protein